MHRGGLPDPVQEPEASEAAREGEAPTFKEATGWADTFNAFSSDDDEGTSAPLAKDVHNVGGQKKSQSSTNDESDSSDSESSSDAESWKDSSSSPSTSHIKEAGNDSDDDSLAGWGAARVSAIPCPADVPAEVPPPVAEPPMMAYAAFSEPPAMSSAGRDAQALPSWLRQEVVASRSAGGDESERAASERGSSRSRSGSPRPRIPRDRCPLPRLAGPTWHPDIQWWGGPIYDYFAPIMKTFPRATRRKVRMELNCAGTAGEVAGLAVPEAFTYFVQFETSATSVISNSLTCTMAASTLYHIGSMRWILINSHA